MRPVKWQGILFTNIFLTTHASSVERAMCEYWNFITSETNTWPWELWYLTDFRFHGSWPKFLNVQSFVPTAIVRSLWMKEDGTEGRGRLTRSAYQDLDYLTR